MESLTITKDKQQTITPEKALEMLLEGNKRFVNGKMVNRDLLEQVNITSGGQFPFAAILGCIDSRAPAEIIFDQGIGDLFNVRIAGNFVNTDILGSLEFACKVAGAKIILVLGHSKCGAIQGASAGVKLGNLSNMLENIKPAVDAVKKEFPEKENNDPVFLQGVSEKNVTLTVENIKNRSEVLKEMYDNKEINIIGGMFDVDTGKVTILNS